jgi:hypothetical protein
VSEHIPAELRRRVRRHFAECCAYCHSAEHLTVVTFELEHITPTSTQGPSVFENLCLSCPTCNRRKSDRTTFADPATGDIVALFHPHRDVWRDHFSWNTDRSQIVARTPTGRATIAALGMNRPQLVRTRRLWVALGEHPPSFDQ